MQTHLLTNDQSEAEKLEVAVAQVIAACDGDLRATIRALIVANAFLEKQVPHNYQRGVNHRPFNCFGMRVMVWRSQKNYELTNKHDFKRLSWRDRRIIPRAFWVAALAIPLGAGDDGPESREAVECTSTNAAIRTAERVARAEGHVCAVAFSRTGDPGSGDFANAVLRLARRAPSD